MGLVTKPQKDIQNTVVEQTPTPIIGDSLFGASIKGDRNDKWVAIGGFIGSNAWVFKVQNNTLVQDFRFNTTVLGIDVAGDGQVGRDVDIDGNLFVVGMPKAEADPNPGGASHGALWAVRRINGTWTPEERLQSDNPEGNDEFGRAVAVAEDPVRGDILVTADSDSDLYIFRNLPGGTDAWTLEKKFANIGAGFKGRIDAEPGVVAAIDAGTSTVVVLEDFDGNGEWARQDLNTPKGMSGIGFTVALHNNLLIVSDDSGVNVFRRIGGLWKFEATIKDPLGNSTFGDGSLGVRNTVNGDHIYASTTNNKEVQIFEGNAGFWKHVSTVEPNRDITGLAFGDSGSMVSNLIVVGAPVSDIEATDQGSVFVWGPVLKGRPKPSTPVNDIAGWISGLVAYTDGEIGEFRASFDSRTQEVMETGITHAGRALSDPGVVGALGKHIALSGNPITNNRPVNDITLSLRLQAGFGGGTSKSVSLNVRKNEVSVDGDVSTFNELLGNKGQALNDFNAMLTSVAGTQLRLVGA